MKFYNGLVESLQEALKDAKGEIKLSKTKVNIKPIIRFTPDEIRNIRIANNMTQSVFAGYLDVSNNIWFSQVILILNREPIVLIILSK